MRPFCSTMNMRGSPGGCTMASGVLMPLTTFSSFTCVCATDAVPHHASSAATANDAPNRNAFIESPPAM